MEGEDRREWAVETGRGRAEGGTGRAETESVACVLVPSPVRPLSAGDLWHRDWEQSPLPALYCYYWQLMRPDGLSSTALNRGLHLHESQDLPFPFFPLSSFYFLLLNGSGVPKVCKEIRQAEWTEAHGRECALAAPSSCCMLRIRPAALLLQRKEKWWITLWETANIEIFSSEDPAFDHMTSGCASYVLLQAWFLGVWLNIFMILGKTTNLSS